MWLSDGPKCSKTIICADDSGSALNCLTALKTQASNFCLAARCAGLHLKPAECVLIITACDLSEHLSAFIRNWLRIHAPEFKCAIIAESVKFLGCYLGWQSATLSFGAPSL